MLLVVNFDLDEGQVVELCHPGIFSKTELGLLAMQAFPDTHLPDNCRTRLVFTFRGQAGLMLGVSCFIRKKVNSHRGYSQKTFVAMSPDWQLAALAQAAERMLQEHERQDRPFLEAVKGIRLAHQEQAPGHCFLEQDKALAKLVSAPQPFQEVDVLGLLPGDSLVLAWAFWEMALANIPLILYSPDCERASFLAAWVLGALWPLQFMGEVRPYLTVYDPQYESFREMTARGMQSGLLAGVSNLLFKTHFKDTVVDLELARAESLISQHRLVVRPPAHILQQMRLAPPSEAHSHFMRTHFRRLTLEFLRPVALFLGTGGKAFKDFEAWLKSQHLRNDFLGPY